MRLTISKIKSAPIGKKQHDGQGLYLTLSKTNRGKWTMRYMTNRKAREIGLGPYPKISLSDARKKLFEARILIVEGKDPLIERRKAEAIIKREEAVKFSSIAKDYIAEHSPEWTSKVHKRDWPSTMERYAYAILDQKPLSHITTEDVIAVLKPIWFDKYDTAQKVRGRIKLIIGYAKAAGLYAHENPALWQDHLAHYFPKLDAPHLIKHHRSLHYNELPDFFRRLKSINGAASKALQYTILTAARTSEVRLMKREEIDFKNMLWSVPANRMKARRPHRVPLSNQAGLLIDEALTAHNYPFIFHGRNPEKPLSNMAMLSLLKKQFEDIDTTVHGLRSTFRTWASETTNYQDSIMEFALAHQVDEKIEGAYNRTELVERRRPLMQDWANYATSAATRHSSVVH